MILVTQGHEKSISLEVFLKSFLCLSTHKQKSIILYCYKNSLIKTLDSLKINYEIKFDQLYIINSILSLKFVTISGSETLNCIKMALNDICKEDILLTLPSSKDQFKGFSGHTEYFRNYFKTPCLPMSFLSENLNVSLLTDHIALKDVSLKINTSDILNKLKILIEGYSLHKKINRIIFSGINPHSGENGLMGNEEIQIEEAISKLKTDYLNIEFLGPLPADTLIFNDIKSDDLVIFSSHDQGLGIFKQQSGLLGINITYGLPFLRVSPDHGTAFDLYLKNSANYYGCLYLLETFTS